MAAPKVYLTRRCTFSACHRLHSPFLTDSENEITYGKCNNLNGHGHNYVVEATLYGPLVKETGMVENLTKVKAVMDKAIMEPMDHKNLDLDVDYFKSIPSTTENVAIFIWNNMIKYMDNPSLLYEIKIYETENNIIRYRGN